MPQLALGVQENQTDWPPGLTRVGGLAHLLGGHVGGGPGKAPLGKLGSKGGEIVCALPEVVVGRHAPAAAG